MKAVLPNMDGLHSQVKSALENTAESELRADAIKVHEALLVRPTHTCTHARPYARTSYILRES